MQRERNRASGLFPLWKWDCLSGALPRDYKPVGAQCNKKWFQPDNMPRVMDFLDRLEPMCRKYDCAVADLAMAWVLAQGGKVILLSGATTKNRSGRIPGQMNWNWMPRMWQPLERWQRPLIHKLSLQFLHWLFYNDSRKPLIYEVFCQ